MMECIAEKVGLKIGNIIFLVAGTKELICKDCKIECPYQFKDYTKADYKAAKKGE